MRKKKKKGGKKFDQGKAPVTLIPFKAITETAKAFEYGAKKYGRYNFREGIAYTRLLDAAIRHIGAFSEGQDFDEESGYSHVGHAMANLSMLIDMYERHPELDDRWKK